MSRQKYVRVFVAQSGLASFIPEQASVSAASHRTLVLCIWCLCAPSRTRQWVFPVASEPPDRGPVPCRGLRPRLLKFWEVRQCPWCWEFSELDGTEGRQDLVSVWTTKTHLCARPPFRSRLGVHVAALVRGLQAGEALAAPPVRTLRRGCWPTRRKGVCRPGRGT